MTVNTIHSLTKGKYERQDKIHREAVSQGIDGFPQHTLRIRTYSFTIPNQAIMDIVEVKKALNTALNSSVFTQEFSNKWEYKKGRHKEKSTAETACSEFRSKGYYTKMKTLHFDGSPMTFWVAMKLK